MRLDDNRVTLVKCDNGYILDYRTAWGVESGGKHKVIIEPDLDKAVALIKNLMLVAEIDR